MADRPHTDDQRPGSFHASPAEALAGPRLHQGDLPMTVIAHHMGEQLILNAAIGSGLPSSSLLVLRSRVSERARGPLRRHR